MMKSACFASRPTGGKDLVFAMVLVLLLQTVRAAELTCPKCGCESSLRMVEVKRIICKMVPKEEPIKKTVYEKKEVPYCEHCPAKLGDLIQHHAICPSCLANGRTKTVLVKKSVECGKKIVYECIPEEITEVVCVPCTRCGFCVRHQEGVKFAEKVPSPPGIEDSPSKLVSSRRKPSFEPVSTVNRH